MIVDGELVRVGSSNLNNRSMGFDTECDLAVEARQCETPDAVRATITHLRDGLVSEHLGVSRERLAEALDEAEEGLTPLAYLERNAAVRLEARVKLAEEGGEVRHLDQQKVPRVAIALPG